MTEWLLDYDGAALTLRVPEGEAEALPYSAFYKLSLRRYIAKRESGLFTGKSALTYLDFQRVVTLCEKECARRGAALTVSPALADYIQDRGSYLTQRFRLGVEIKNREEKLLPRFREYQSIVNATMARPLRERQMWDSFFLCAMKRAANFSVPGSGKTASVLGVYACLKSRGLIRRLWWSVPKTPSAPGWRSLSSASLDGRNCGS